MKELIKIYKDLGYTVKYYCDSTYIYFETYEITGESDGEANLYLQHDWQSCGDLTIELNDAEVLFEGKVKGDGEIQIDFKDCQQLYDYQDIIKFGELLKTIHTEAGRIRSQNVMYVDTKSFNL